MSYNNITEDIFKSYLSKLPRNIIRKAKIYAIGAEARAFPNKLLDVLYDRQSKLLMFKGTPGGSTATKNCPKITHQMKYF